MRATTLDAVKLPSHSIKIMANLLRERGYALDRALKVAELAPAILDDPTSDITGLQELGFQQAFCDLTKDNPELWMELGTRYGLLSHARDFYGLAMATAATVQDALEVAAQLSEYHCTLAQGFGLFESGRRVGVRSDDSEVPERLKLFTILRDIGINCRVYSELWGGSFPYRRIELPISGRYARIVKHHLPDAVIDFESHRNVWYYSTFVDQRRPPLSDPVLHQFYRGICDTAHSPRLSETSLQDQLLQCIEQSNGHLCLSEAAERLGMSVRSLQRRLGECGASFRDIAQTARHNLASRKLRDGNQSIAEIAFEAGYQDLASFYRAFRTRTGLTPARFRAQGRS